MKRSIVTMFSSAVCFAFAFFATANQAQALTQAELDTIVAAAEQIWVDAGIDAAQLSALQSATYAIADLGAEDLAAVDGYDVVIDDNAAGLGWFIDPTPGDDLEFDVYPLYDVVDTGTTTQEDYTDENGVVFTLDVPVWDATPNGEVVIKLAEPPSIAAGGIDLLSVVLMEQGHILGLDHVDESGNVMGGGFALGERKLPYFGQADGAVPGSLTGVHYAHRTANWRRVVWGVNGGVWNNPGTAWRDIDQHAGARLPGWWPWLGGPANAIIQGATTANLNSSFTPDYFFNILIVRFGPTLNINNAGTVLDLQTSNNGPIPHVPFQIGNFNNTTDRVNQNDGTTVLVGSMTLGNNGGARTGSNFAEYNLKGTLDASGGLTIRRSGTLRMYVDGYSDSAITVDSFQAGSIQTVQAPAAFPRSFLAGPITLTQNADFRGNGNEFSGGITSAGNQSLSLNGQSWIEANPIDLNGGVMTFTSNANDPARATELNVAGNDWSMSRINFGGYVKMGVDNAWPADARIEFGWHQVNTSSGTLDLNGFDQQVGGLHWPSFIPSWEHRTADRTVTSTGGEATLTIDPLGASYTYFGNFEGALNIVKTGAGTQIIDSRQAAASTRTGDTTVNNGVLLLEQADLPDGGDVHLNGGLLWLRTGGGVLDTIDQLFVNGVEQCPGIYNGGNTPYMTGSGSLLVTGEETPPVIICPSDITIAADASTCEATIPDLTLLAGYSVTDNCDATPTVIQSPAAGSGVMGVGGNVITLTATDDEGNSSDCTVNVTVRDITAPVLAAPPADVAVQCVESVPAMTNVAFTDNCDADGSVAGVDGPLTGGACGGTITRTWSVSDSSGNTATPVSQTITVNDTIAPTATQGSIEACYADAALANAAALAATTALSDNCGPAPTKSVQTGAGDCDTSITIRVQDACGNFTDYTYNTRVDGTAPSIACPADVTVECDETTDSEVAEPAGAIVHFTFDDADTDTAARTVYDVSGSATVHEGSYTGSGAFNLTQGVNRDAAVLVGVNVNCVTVPDHPEINTSDVSVRTIGLWYNATTGLFLRQTLWEEGGSGNGLCIYIQNNRLYVGEWVNNHATNLWLSRDISGTANEWHHVAMVLDVGNSRFDAYFDGSTSGWTVEASSTAASAFTVLNHAGDTCIGARNGTTRYVDGTTSGGGIGGGSNSFDGLIDNFLLYNTALSAADISTLATAGTGVATATDNCSDAGDITVSSSDSVAAGSCAQESTITRTWTATDASGNSSQCVQTIEVVDTTAPVIGAAGADATVECGDPVVFTAPTATDNCNPAPPVFGTGNVITPSCGSTYTQTRSWQAFDGCGNGSAQVSQTITVVDTTAPSFTTPADTTISSDANCTYDASVGVTGDVTDESDNCDVGDATFSDSVDASDACNIVITRTWSLSDACGNTSSGTQTITVVDDSAPVLACPPDVTLECDVVAVNTLVADAVTDYVNGTAVGQTSQDVSNNGWDYLASSTQDPNDPAAVLQPLQWTFFGAGPGGQWVLPGSDGPWVRLQGSIFINPRTGPNTAVLRWTSDIDGAVIISGRVSNNSTEETVELRLACSGEALFSQVIAPNATETFEFNVVLNVGDTVDLTVDEAPGGASGASFEFAQLSIIQVVGAVPTVSDNCDSDPCVEWSDSVAPGACVGSSIITRTFTAMDDCGNTSQCVQTITADDTTAPEITCAQDTTVECDDPSVVGCVGQYVRITNPDRGDNQHFLHLRELEVYSGGLNVALGGTASQSTNFGGNDGSNAIDGNLGTISHTHRTNPDGEEWLEIDLGALYEIDEIRLYNRTDCCSFRLQNYTVAVLDGPGGNEIWSQGPNPTPAGAVASHTVGAAVFDNCDDNPTLTSSDSVVAGSCPAESAITRTWTATDACGNSSVHVQTISIVDTTDPTLTVPANVTIECTADESSASNGVATGSDNCGGVVISESDVSAPGCGDTKVITRTWVATDDCGNTTGGDQTITVIDTTAPVITITGANPETVQCGDSYTDAGATANDSCDGDLGGLTGSGSVITTSVGSYTITYSVSDACGNTASATRTVNVVDTVAPTVTCPAGTSASADASCSALIPDVTTTASASDSGCDDGVTLTQDPAAGTLVSLGTHTITVTATDNAGNSSDCTTTFTVTDDTDPTASNPAAVNVQCSVDVPAADITVVTDEADNCTAEPVVAHVGDSSDGNTCPEVITRTYSVTDGAGNSINVTQTITVDDTIAPVIGAAPADVTVECSVDVPAAAVLNWTDNCDAGGTVTGVDSSDGLTCPETITRTWNVSDACGNAAATQTQIITVHDITAPVITVDSADTIVSCGGTFDPLGGVSATDNCDGSVTVNVDSDNTDSGTVGCYTVGYTATDSCGNSSTASQTVIVPYNIEGLLAPLDIQDLTILVSTAATGGELGLDCSDLKAIKAKRGGLPLKIRLTDCNGNTVTDALLGGNEPTVERILAITDNGPAPDIYDVVDPTGASHTDGIMRISTDKWIYTLDIDDTGTDGIAAGCYAVEFKITVPCADGSTDCVYAYAAFKLQ